MTQTVIDTKGTKIMKAQTKNRLRLNWVASSLAAAVMLSPLFAGTAAATINVIDKPGGGCSPATCPIKAPTPGPEAPPPSGPGDTVLPSPDTGGCKGSICFPSK